MGQSDVVLVEDLLLFLVKLVPDVGGCFGRHNVGGPAKVPRLDDAHLQEGSS